MHYFTRIIFLLSVFYGQQKKKYGQLFFDNKKIGTIQEYAFIPEDYQMLILTLFPDF